MANKALLIGVSRYERAGLGALKAPVEDVRRLASCLENAGKFDLITLIDPPKAELELNARGLLRDATPLDKVVFYYSGHGLRDFKGTLWLTTPTVNPDDPWHGGIEASNIKEWGSEGRAGQLVIILDCCFAGALGGRAGSDGVVATRGAFVERREGRGIHIVMASDRDQVAPTGDAVPADGRASHFTDLLIRGLEGDAAPGEDRVTIRRLSEFLLEKGPEQLGITPVVDVEKGRGDFPLVTVADPERTLLDRHLRNAAKSPRLVERVGAAVLLGRVLQEPRSASQARVARRYLDEMMDAADADDDVRAACKLAIDGTPATKLAATERELEAATRDVADLQEALKEARSQRDLAEEALRKAGNARDSAEDAKRAAVIARDAARADLRDAQHNLALVDQQRVSSENRLAVAREQLRDAMARLAEAERRDPPGLPIEALERLRGELDTARGTAAEAAQRAAAAEASHQVAQARAEALTESLKARDLQISELTQEASKHEGIVRQAEEKAKQAAQLAEQAIRRVDQLHSSLNEANTKLASSITDLDAAKSANAALRAQRDRQDASIFEKDATLKSQETEIQELRALIVTNPGEELGPKTKIILFGRHKLWIFAIAIMFVAGLFGWIKFNDAHNDLANTEGRISDLERQLEAARRPSGGPVSGTVLARPVEPLIPGLPPRPTSPISDCPECPRLVQVDAQPPYMISEDPITVGQFKTYLRLSGNPPPSGGCRTPALSTTVAADQTLSWSWPGFDQTDQHPVVCVNYADANNYVGWLRQRSGRGNAYRLPSPAEREDLLASRFRSQDDLPANRCTIGNIRDASLRNALLNNPSSAVAAPDLLRLLQQGRGLESWAPCNDEHPFTAPVGRVQPINGVRGLYGNTLDWTSEVSGGGQIVAVGLSWSSPPPSDNRVLWRGDYNGSTRFNFIGFRVVRSP